MALTTHPDVELRIKKEQSYTSTGFPCCHSLLKGNIVPFIFSLDQHKDTDNCECRGNARTLCEQKRSQGHLAAGGMRVLGRHKHQRLRFVQTAELLEASPRGIGHSANVRQLSLFCGIRSFATSIWHTGTASKETSGGIIRTAAVQAIILNVCSVTYSCRLTKTDVTLTSASQTVSCYDEQPM